MNRRFVRSLLLAALLVLLCTQVFAAQETLAVLRLDPEPGFTTRMEDTDGNTLTRSGVLNPDGLANSVRSAKIASYSIYYNGRLLMTVTPVGFSEPDAAVMSGGAPTCTGFYKTTFSIDDTREIFLTGLTESTLEQVQTELTASALEDRYFSLTNVDFIDAEKEFTDVAEGEIASDANLCWAAASSNMLRFSGWGSEAGFRTEDDLFESFISAFTDAGGSYTYGLDWFFNGYYAMQGNDGWAQLRAPGESGKYLSEYPADSLYQTYEISNHIDNLRPVLDALERDCAVGISIGNYLSSFRIGGHAITLWGYLHDTSASPYSKEAYPAIFISDSDSDKYDGALRRQAPNRLRVMMMDGMFDGFGADSWELDYPSTFPWRLESFTVLEPYRAELEQDASGTHNKNISADFSVQDLYVRASTFDDLELGIDTIPANQSFKIGGIALNNSAVNLSSARLQIVTTITQNGQTVWEKNSQRSVSRFSANAYVKLSETCNSLAAGSYEATIRVTASGISEAYLLNNTRSISFTVSAAAPDASNASVSVSIPEFDGRTGGYGTLRFGSVDSLYPAGTELTWSVYEKYDSVLYDGWVLAYQGYQQPESVRYEGMTTAVRTLVVLRPVDPSLACVTLDAGSQKLLYHRVYTLAADDNTGICSAIAYGQNTLAAGEQFSFYISNFTTCTPSITVTPVVYAIRSSDNLRIDLWRGEAMRMAYGESTENAPCRVASWSAELLPGQYTIYGEAVYEYGSKTVKLSTLQVNADKPWCSVMQTFRGDGRCAVILACSGPEGSLPFGVEYRKDGQEEANRVSSNLYLNKGYITSFCISFESDASAKYSFRAFCEADDGTIYTDWYECPAPAAQLLTLDTQKTGSTGETVWEFFAPEDGVYVLSLKSTALAEVYETSRTYRSGVLSDDPMARNFYLKKGESTLIRIQTEGSYTIGFTTIPELELGQTTSCLYKTGDSERCFRFTAPADGVYLFTAAGESYAAVYISDGSVTRWERRGALQSGSPAVAGMELKKGQTAYVRLQYMTRDYRYSVSVFRPAPEVSVSDEGVNVSYDPEFTGLHLIALYDADGRMVDVQYVPVQSLDTRISVVLRGTKTGFVRVFQLDAEKNTPLTAAKQIELV
jgi:hypothetical protein